MHIRHAFLAPLILFKVQSFYYFYLVYTSCCLIVKEYSCGSVYIIQIKNVHIWLVSVSCVCYFPKILFYLSHVLLCIFTRQLNFLKWINKYIIHSCQNNKELIKIRSEIFLNYINKYIGFFIFIKVVSTSIIILRELNCRLPSSG